MADALRAIKRRLSGNACGTAIAPAQPAEPRRKAKAKVDAQIAQRWMLSLLPLPAVQRQSPLPTDRDSVWFQSSGPRT